MRLRGWATAQQRALVFLAGENSLQLVLYFDALGISGVSSGWDSSSMDAIDVVCEALSWQRTFHTTASMCEQ